MIERCIITFCCTICPFSYLLLYIEFSSVFFGFYSLEPLLHSHSSENCFPKLNKSIVWLGMHYAVFNAFGELCVHVRRAMSAMCACFHVKCNVQRRRYKSVINTWLWLLLLYIFLCCWCNQAIFNNNFVHWIRAMLPLLFCAHRFMCKCPWFEKPTINGYFYHSSPLLRFLFCSFCLPDIIADSLMHFLPNKWQKKSFLFWMKIETLAAMRSIEKHSKQQTGNCQYLLINKRAKKTQIVLIFYDSPFSAVKQRARP